MKIYLVVEQYESGAVFAFTDEDKAKSAAESYSDDCYVQEIELDEAQKLVEHHVTLRDDGSIVSGASNPPRYIKPSAESYLETVSPLRVCGVSTKSMLEAVELAEQTRQLWGPKTC